MDALFPVIEDQRVEHLIDLDQAAAQISGRLPQWTTTGLLVGPITWRDGAADWPQRLEQDRSRVADPDSVGINICGPAGSELLVVLYRGGWADVDFVADLDLDLVTEAPDVGTPQQFGELLDGYVSRAFGSPPSGPRG